MHNASPTRSEHAEQAVVRMDALDPITALVPVRFDLAPVTE